MYIRNEREEKKKFETILVCHVKGHIDLWGMMVDSSKKKIKHQKSLVDWNQIQNYKLKNQTISLYKKIVAIK